MPQTCLPLYSMVEVEIEVSPGTEIRILPDFVDCDDLSFPIPWSNPINVPMDFAYYAQTVNNVLSVNDFYNRLEVFSTAGLTVQYRLTLNPEWTDNFGGCGAKIKVCVRNGSLLNLSFPNGNLLQCCPIEPLPNCDCDERIYYIFRFDDFSPPSVPFNGYTFNFGDVEGAFSCDGGDIFTIPPWVASNPSLRNDWIAAALDNTLSAPIEICRWPVGYVGVGFPLTDDILYLCNARVYRCVGARLWPSGFLTDASLASMSFPFSNETGPIYHCCSTPPSPDYPPNHCLPPCGCEKACDAVGCFDELAVRLKSGLTGYPPPGATVTVFIQEGYRKLTLTGVYDGTGVKITLTEQQKKFFIFFRSYSAAVFWNGQIWPMADDAQCKYFVAYPGPSQTTLTI